MCCTHKMVRFTSSKSVRGLFFFAWGQIGETFFNWCAYDTNYISLLPFRFLCRSPLIVSISHYNILPQNVNGFRGISSGRAKKRRRKRATAVIPRSVDIFLQYVIVQAMKRPRARGHIAQGQEGESLPQAQEHQQVGATGGFIKFTVCGALRFRERGATWTA